MHILTLREPVNLGKTLGILEAGEWLMHDLNAFEIARMAPRGTATISEWPDEPVKAVTEDSSTLIIRSGAIGDLLLLTPVIDAWKMKYHAPLTISCFAHHAPIFKNASKVMDVVRYPLPLREADKFQNIISLENTMECDHEHHATDVFAKALGLETPLHDYRPRYYATEEEKAATAKHLFTNRPNIVVQMRASVANRDYPLPLWSQVIHKLVQRGWGVLIIGRKGEFPHLPPELEHPFIRDLARLGLTFRESAAVLAQAQAFVGVDSAWSHMCHALDIPAVVLSAAFDWKTRTAHAPKTIALSGVGECAPCNWHMHAGQMFPPNKPCSRVRECVVLAGIPPERVVAKCDLMKP